MSGTDTIDFLNMSDEDFAKFGQYPPQEDFKESSDSSDSDDDTEQEQEEISEDTNDNDSEESSNEEEETLNSDEKDTSIEDEEEEQSDSEEEETDEIIPDGEENEISTEEAFYKALTAPIKANGKEIQIQNADEAIKLIQMGAGFNKKLNDLKPARQLFKTLEQNKMLDEASISFAIDLVNGNTDAIIKLMKEKNIDPLSLDTEKDSNYKSEINLVSEKSIEFDDVIDSIKDSEHYNDTITTIQKWDKNSQVMLSQDPRIIEQLNVQMSNGVYQTIKAELDKQQALGNPQLMNMSDLEAYVAIGRYMAEKGDLPDPSTQSDNTTSTVNKVLPKAKSKSNSNTMKKKKAASVPKGKQTSDNSSSEDINPLSMSDDEFEKLMQKFG